MNPKSLLTIGLLAFVAASVVYLAVAEVNRPADEPSAPRVSGMVAEPATSGPAPAPAATQPGDGIVVYYFHTNVRCASCIKIENYTATALDGAFAGELRDGRVQWVRVNLDEPGNKHFVDDYELATKSVVVVDRRRNKQVRWKNLSKIWELLFEKEAFVSYIEDEVRAYLRSG